MSILGIGGTPGVWGEHGGKICISTDGPNASALSHSPRELPSEIETILFPYTK